MTRVFLLVRPGSRHREAPTEVFDRGEFLRRVGDHVIVSEQESERLTRAVFEAIRMWLPGCDVREVAIQLPEDSPRSLAHPSDSLKTDSASRGMMVRSPYQPTPCELAIYVKLRRYLPITY